MDALDGSQVLIYSVRTETAVFYALTYNGAEVLSEGHIVNVGLKIQGN